MLREIKISKNKELKITIPNKYINRKLEIIVFPIDEIENSEIKVEQNNEKLKEFEQLKNETLNNPIIQIDNTTLNNLMNSINFSI